MRMIFSFKIGAMRGFEYRLGIGCGVDYNTFKFYRSFVDISNYTPIS